MDGIILALRDDAAAKAVAGVLLSGGVRSGARAASGAQVLRSARRFDTCTVICDGPLTDMPVLRLRELLPPRHFVVLISRTREPDAAEAGVLCLRAPVNRREFLGAMRMLAALGGQVRPGDLPHAADERELIRRAKELLMARFGMEENQAHRFLQRRSMERGAKLADTAAVVITEME